MMRSLLEEGPLVIALEVPMSFNSATTGHVVGEGYINSLRQMRTDPHRDPKTDKERASPEDHHRRAPLPLVKMMEARWNLKDSPKCASKGEHETVNDHLQLDFGEAFVSRETHRFALNSDKLPASKQPFEQAER